MLILKIDLINFILLWFFNITGFLLLLLLPIFTGGIFNFILSYIPSSKLRGSKCAGVSKLIFTEVAVITVLIEHKVDLIINFK